jgi:hypothetical protein
MQIPYEGITMFDKLTTNATVVAQTVTTRLTTAADKFAEVVTTTVDDVSKKARNVEFDLTKFDVSKIDLPKIDLPKIDVAPEVAKAADLARDVAYAGLGVAALAIHQVDAGVRRVAARAA